MIYYSYAHAKSFLLLSRLAFKILCSKSALFWMQSLSLLMSNKSMSSLFYFVLSNFYSNFFKSLYWCQYLSIVLHTSVMITSFKFILACKLDGEHFQRGLVKNCSYLLEAPSTQSINDAMGAERGSWSHDYALINPKNQYFALDYSTNLIREVIIM